MSVSNLQLIASQYVAWFYRAPDQTGQDFWEGYAQSSGASGLDLTKQLSSLFFQNPVASAVYAGMGNAAFVNAVYVNVGGKPADAGGLQFWTTKLNEGMTRSDFVAEFSYYVLTLTDADLANLNLTPQELADAQARRAFLEHRIEVGLQFTEAMGSGSNLLPTTDPNNAASVQLDPAYVAAQNIIRGVNEDPASMGPPMNYLAGTPTIAGINQLFGVPPGGEGGTFIFTTGQDILLGTAGADSFFATQDTLQLGDSANGGGGYDTLNLSISGHHGADLIGFNTESVEELIVKSLASGSSTIDMSGTKGVVKLTSFETDGGSLTFRDIQSVNKTAIEIVDTDEDHTFIYDLNAYDPAALDVVDLTVQELRGHYGAPDITFLDRDWSPSNIDQINLHSLKRPDAGASPAVNNYIDELNVGSKFDVLTIDGDADLEIEKTLDDHLRVINAAGLAADLTLDVATKTSVGTFIYTGAQGDDNLDVWRNGNNDIALNTGDDDLKIEGNGNNTISGGPGDDKVRIEGDGRHNIDLGSGNDTLRIDGNVDNYDTSAVGDGVTTIIAGSGDDSVRIYGDGDYNVDLGAGNDYFYKQGNSSHTIVAGDGNDTVIVDGGGGASSNVVDLGGGNDLLTITGNGTQNITAGGGNDTITVNGNGNVTATGDDGNDVISIHGHGVHNINLGAGDDYLLIDGGRKDPAVTEEDNSGNDAMTTVVGGTGNDTVDVRLDHYLNADLGEGDDLIILRARDLTSDDMVLGGAGRDTMRLTNQSYEDQLVGQSETGSTTSFEVFDLRNANITLRLTSDNFDTAQNKAITVYTQEADRTTLPANLVALGLAQGMTVSQFTAVAQAFGPTANVSDSVARANLAKYLLNDGVQGVNFADTNSDGDSVVYTSSGAVPGSIAVEGPSGTSPSIINTSDIVNFRMEPDGYMAVDLTAVPLSLASGRTFTLDGGNIKDVVIADDDSINGRSTLRFDGPASANQSVEDTLYVVGQADIEAADLRNVSGLENIVLTPNGSQPGVWEIVLTAPVVNQTTGSAPLSIFVDPDVPAGSDLRITLDPTVMTSLNNDVFIYRNSNVQVYINGDLVTEPEYGVTDFNGSGAYVVKVLSQNFFTTNADRLIGTAGVDDWFIARSLDQVQSGDEAWGYAPLNGPDAQDDDTVEFRFAVANPTTSLQDQLENAAFISIENFVFSTENNVRMLGIGAPWFAPDLKLLHTGGGDDILAFMRTGLTYVLDGGDDWISLESVPGSTTVYGGSGSDSLYGGFSNDTVYVDKVEYINVDGGSDQVNLMSANPDLVTVLGVETLNGSSGDDWVYADNAGGPIWVDMGLGNDTLTVGGATPTNATVYGGGGDDSLTVNATVSALVYGDDNNGATADGNDTISVNVPNGSVTVYGEGGNDSISVYVAGGSAWVDAGSGNDTVSISAPNPGGDGTVLGGSGDDSIYVHAWTNASIDGGSGNDTINSDWSNFTTVNGGSGDDSIDVVVFNQAFVNGDSGNDTITVNGNGYANLKGGDGNDSISQNSGAYTDIFGDAGNDTISLSVGATNQDNLHFGTIGYNALQQQTTNTQGLDSISGFNFEAFTPGDPAPLRQDAMDFAQFLTGTIPLSNMVTFAGTYVRGTTTVDANNGAGNSLVVISNANGASFGPADFSTGVAGTIQLNDNGRAVVVVGLNETGPGSGISSFDAYYVQDVDTGAGQTWKVDKVAHIDALTAVGVAAVMDNLQFGLTIGGTGGDNTFISAIGPQTFDLSAGGDDTIVYAGSPYELGVDTILSFDPGFNDDELDFSAYYVSLNGLESGGGSFVNSISTFSTASVGDANLDGRFALYNAGAGNIGNVDSPAEIAALINGAGNAFSMSAGGIGMVMTGAVGTSDAYMWNIADFNNDGNITANEVVQLASMTLTGGQDINDFWSQNFIF